MAAPLGVRSELVSYGLCHKIEAPAGTHYVLSPTGHVALALVEPLTAHEEQELTSLAAQAAARFEAAAAREAKRKSRR